jgi:uncharacterized membrane protein
VSAVASYYAARSLLLVLFLVIGFSVFAAVSMRRCIRREPLFLILITSVSLSLILSGTLTSTGLHGYDIYQEFSIFAQVSRERTWHAETGMTYNTALSISILPVMLSTISGLDGIHIFTLVFPAIFSIAPVMLYKIYRKIVTAEAAYLSVFLFMSYPSFYVEMVQLGRQEIAELLFVLLILIFLSPKLSATHSGRILILLYVYSGLRQPDMRSLLRSRTRIVKGDIPVIDPRAIYNALLLSSLDKPTFCAVQFLRIIVC